MKASSNANIKDVAMIDTINNATAGWYEDPANERRMRYWDGFHWTSQTTDATDQQILQQLENEAIFQSTLPDRNNRWWEGKQWYSSAKQDGAAANSTVNEGVAGHAGWYPDPRGENELRWWDGGNWQDATSTKEAASAEYAPKPTASLPAINEWKPAPLFSVLGVIANFAIGSVLEAITMSLFGVLIYAAVLTAAAVVYSVVFYRSYFTEKPLIKSSKAISFLNYFVGWVVFGWCWNKNLRRSNETGKPQKGISYIVIIVLYGLMLSYCIGVSLYSAFSTPLPSSHTANMSARNADDSAIAHTSSFVNEAYGFSVDFPTTPELTSKTLEMLGVEVPYDNWLSEDDGNCYLVGTLKCPDGLPIEDAAGGIYGGLSGMIMSLCSSFDISPEEADIRYDDYLGCPSAYTMFAFDGMQIEGRALWNNNTAYIISAVAPSENQTAAFMSSFRFI